MKTLCSIVLVAVACTFLGCSNSSAKQVQIQVNIDKDQKCAVGKHSFDMSSLRGILQKKRQKSMGNCSVQILCATNLSAMTLFQVINDATMVGIYNVSLQLEGDSGSVDCSRPTPEQAGIQEPPELNEVSETEELPEPQEASAPPLSIDVSAKQMSINGKNLSLSDLENKLKGKKGNVFVKAKSDTSIKQIYSILKTCEANSLKPWLFAL